MRKMTRTKTRMKITKVMTMTMATMMILDMMLAIGKKNMNLVVKVIVLMALMDPLVRLQKKVVTQLQILYTTYLFSFTIFNIYEKNFSLTNKNFKYKYYNFSDFKYENLHDEMSPPSKSSNQDKPHELSTKINIDKCNLNLDS